MWFSSGARCSISHRMTAPKVNYTRVLQVFAHLTSSHIRCILCTAIHLVNIHIGSTNYLMFKESWVSAQPVLLGLLTLGPSHPYELHQELERELGRVWHVGLSHMYAYLQQLAEAGLVTVETEAQPNRPARNVYHITPAGEEAFANWLHRPSQHVRHIRLEFLARLYFYRRLSLPGLEQLVSEQKELFQSRIESLSRTIAETEDGYWRLVLEFRRGEMEAVMHWLDRCLQTR